MRAEDAQGTPTKSHVSPSVLVYEDNTRNADETAVDMLAGAGPVSQGHHRSLGIGLL